MHCLNRGVTLELVRMCLVITLARFIASDSDVQLTYKHDKLIGERNNGVVCRWTCACIRECARFHACVHWIAWWSVCGLIIFLWKIIFMIEDYRWIPHHHRTWILMIKNNWWHFWCHSVFKKRIWATTSRQRRGNFCDVTTWKVGHDPCSTMHTY